MVDVRIPHRLSVFHEKPKHTFVWSVFRSRLLCTPDNFQADVLTEELAEGAAGSLRESGKVLGNSDGGNGIVSNGKASNFDGAPGDEDFSEAGVDDDEDEEGDEY